MLGSEVVNGTQELASVSVTYQGYLLAIELGNVMSWLVGTHGLKKVTARSGE